MASPSQHQRYSTTSQHRRRRASLVSTEARRNISQKADTDRDAHANDGSGAGSTVQVQPLRKNSVSQRPSSHFCRACGRLMLSSQRHPVRLEPCGHTVCGRCADLSINVDSGRCCPVCRSGVTDHRPDELLKLEVTKLAEKAVAADGDDFPAGEGLAAQQQLPPQQQQEQVPQQRQQTRLTAANNSLVLVEQKQKSLRHTAPAVAIGKQPQASVAEAPGGKQWHRQLDMIGSRMRSLESSLEQLESELASLNAQLSTEVDRERQLRRAEAEARDLLERQQEEIRRIVEQRSASSEAQAQFQTQLEAKRRAIQVALAAQHAVSIELSRLQTLCGGSGSGGSSGGCG